MDIIRKNEELFFKKQMDMAKGLFDANQKIIMERENETISSMGGSLCEVFNSLIIKFKSQREETVTKDASFIQISFLRSGILCAFPCYRVDIYDDSWMLSELECSLNWQPDFMIEGLCNIRDALQKVFSNQMSCPLYRMDQIVMEFAEQFNCITEVFLKKAITNLFSDPDFSKKFNGCKVYSGEFLDKCSCVYDNGDVK